MIIFAAEKSRLEKHFHSFILSLQVARDSNYLQDDSETVHEHVDRVFRFVFENLVDRPVQVEVIRPSHADNRHIERREVPDLR